MSKTISLALRATDAEPVLWRAAKDAAKYGAWVDHITRRTVNAPGAYYGRNIDDQRREWNAKFLSAKRIVEAFGVEHEATTEAETLGEYIPVKVLKSHPVKVGGIRFEHVDKSVPDPKNKRPRYRGAPHLEACKAAADRVVAKWKATLENREAA